MLTLKKLTLKEYIKFVKRYFDKDLHTSIHQMIIINCVSLMRRDLTNE